MITFTRLHVLRLRRSPLARAAILSSVVLPAMLVVSTLLLARISETAAKALPEVLSGGPACFGVFIAVGFAGWAPASIAHDERVERRVSVLRASGVDGTRAVLELALIALSCAAVTSVGGLAMSAVIALVQGGSLGTVGLQAVAATLAGAALGSVAATMQSIAGRAVWSVVNGLTAIVFAGVIAAAGADRSFPWGALLVALMLGSAACVILALGVAHLGRRFPTSMLDHWT